MPLEENPRVKQLAGRSRRAWTRTASRCPSSVASAIRDALFEAIIDRFYRIPTLVAYGEENRDWGGAFAVYRGLTEALPYHRLFNSPISEGRHRRHGGRLRAGRRPRAGGADVLRLHGPRRRRDLQPAGQVAVDVRRPAEDAASCCACRSAPSTARSTARTGPACARTSPA
jgi:hypothetical protein